MDTKLRKKYTALAHHLKPVVAMGQKGLTEAVLLETDRALFDHELIKVKVVGEDKADRLQIAADICEQLDAQFVKLIGNIAILYRESEKARA